MNASSFAGATRRAIAYRPFRILSKTFASKAKSRVSDALFRSSFQDLAFVYQNTFARLAREFNVTIVGGSVVLPSPRIENGILLCDANAPLKNISGVWNSSGKLQDILTKMSPTEPELAFTQGGNLSDIKAIDTVAGRLGLIICGDGWEQKTYEKLVAQNVDAFVVMAFVPSDVSWNGAWKGYSGKQAEPDVQTGDIGQISEYEAWKKYCLNRATCYKKPSVVFYNRTQLWDFGSHGKPMSIDKLGNVTEHQVNANGAAIICIELD